MCIDMTVTWPLCTSTVQFIKTERFTPLLRTYVQVSFHFYSKSEPYYGFSGSVFAKRVNKKSTGRACVLLQEYVCSKQRKRTIEADDRLCCEPNSVTTWFVPLGRFSEQIDYDIRLVNTAPLIEEQRVVDIDRLIPLFIISYS